MVRPPSIPGRATRMTWHPGDLVRLTAAAAVLAASAWSARGAEPSVVEVNLFRLVNQLPAAVGPPMQGAMQLGALAAVPALAALALLSRRARLARLLLLGGSAAWLVAKLLQTVVDQAAPEVVLTKVVLHGSVQAGLAFPATHVAVAAAMATVAGPYLSRPNRRLLWWLVAVVGVARVYVGAHFPVDVIGGVAVGWGVGSVLHLWLGAPRGRPPASVVERAIAVRGADVVGVDVVEASTPGATLYRVTLRDGRAWLAKVIGRDQPEADWLFRMWRLLAFREVDDARSAGLPWQRAEHEAYLLVLAERAGVRVPSVVTSTPLGDGEALLLRTWVTGHSLVDDLYDASDDVIARVWRQLASLHAAGIAWRGARMTDFVVDRGGEVWIVDLAAGRCDASPADCACDIAELLTLLALQQDIERVVAGAVSTFSAEQLGRAVGFLQPLALSPSIRRRLARHPGMLDVLRARLAVRAGIAVPPPVVPLRIAARNLVPLLAALFAVNLLLPQVGQARSTLAALGRASWPWLLACGVITAATYLMAAVALIGAAGRRLAVGRTWAVQVAAAFTNRLAPAGLGGMSTNVRYLQAAGAPRPAAVTAVGLNSVGGFLVHLVGVLLVVPLLGAGRTPLHLRGPDLPDHWPVLVAVAGTLAAIGVIRWGARIRGRLLPSAKSAWASLRVVLRSPWAATALFGGSAGVTAGYAMALIAAARAMSVGLPTSTIAAIYLGGSAVAAAAPTPGGLGALEAALVAGLTAAGAPAGPAVAAVLAYRAITYWLPVLPGYVALRALRRSGAL